MNWHTRREKQEIRKHGGKPLTKYGYDGVIHGRPVEVRCARKDERYRIQKNVHRLLVRQKGSYIFTSGNRSKKVPAKKVSKLIGRGKWYKDRSYPHKFLLKKKIFR